MPHGAESVRLQDWTGGLVEVALDPTLTPAENANRWYEEARKRERADARIPELLAAARQVVRRVRPSGAGDRFLGNDESLDPRLEAHLERHGVQDERERSRLAAEAAAYDAYMMSHPQAATGYGIEADLGMDGILTVEVSGLDEVPLVLSSLPWTRDGVVAYRVHWEPTDFVELELERPSLAHRVARGRATPQVRGVARALQAVVGGAILDASDFPVDPSTL